MTTTTTITEERYQENRDHWDDFDLLYKPLASTSSDQEALDHLEIFTYKQITQEKLWFTTKHDKLNIFSSSRTVGKLPYILPITALLGHNEKYVVYLGAKTNPNKSGSNDVRSESPTVTIDWPAWPSAEVLQKWQHIDFKETLAEYTETQGSRGSPAAQLFHTADLVAMEDSIKQVSTTSDEPLEEHPRYKTFIKALDERIKSSPKPNLYRHGRVFVGQFAPSDTELVNTIQHWNTDILHRLSFHAQVTMIPDQPEFDNLLVTMDNRTLCIWNLQVAEWGPLASYEFDSSACSTKAASEIVVTPEYIAILNPDKRVTIVPFSGKLFHSIDRRLSPNYTGSEPPLKTLKDVDAYLYRSRSNLVNKNLSSTFYMPTANTLGVNASDPEILYVGTIHGYIHELHIARLFPKDQVKGDTLKCHEYDAVDMDKSSPSNDTAVLNHPHIKMRITHNYTFCTTMAAPVYHVQGRGQRVLCSASHNVFVFNELEVTDKEATARTTLRIETGDGLSMNIRNVKFMGNLVVIETYNRHLLLVHSARNQQRVVPSSLGARQAGNPEVEGTQQQLRDYMGGIMYWDNKKGAIRMAYDNLNSESWQVPVFDYGKHYHRQQEQEQADKK